MLCGDLTGKGVVPLVEEKQGFVSTYYGRRQLFRNEKDVVNAEKQIAMTGLYPLRCTPEQVEQYKSDPKLLDVVMREKIVARMKEWMDLLVQKIDLKKTQVVVMPGNDDDPAVDDVIKSYGEAGVQWALDGPIDIAGFQVASLAHVNPTPWDTPREADEEGMAKLIEAQVAKLDNPGRSIFNFHAPPNGTELDLAPKLKPDLTPVMGAGGVEMIHVGSTAVRDAIKKYRPLIGLHGHIHESAAQDHVDGIPVINPGSEYGEDVLRGAIVETSKEGIVQFWRVEG
ncbi:MAG TPA: phosphoesterase [Bacillota bacterium]|jgi:Icc-related predicted phosphoesterase